MKLFTKLLGIILLLGNFAFAAESETATSSTNAAIQLDCDTSVPGSVCPSKYSARSGLTDDTVIRENTTPPKTTTGAE